MPDVLSVCGYQRTLRETQVVDAVENIGFTNAILSQETIDFLIEVKMGLFVVFEVKQGEFFEVHRI